MSKIKQTVNNLENLNKQLQNIIDKLVDAGVEFELRDNYKFCDLLKNPIGNCKIADVQLSALISKIKDFYGIDD